MGQHDHEPGSIEPVGEEAKYLQRGCIRPVQVAEFTYGFGLSLRPLVRRRVSAGHHLAQDPLRFITGSIRRPR